MTAAIERKSLKPSMLVLEGPECTGKTTMAQLLCEELSCTVTKRVATEDTLELLSTVIGDINSQRLRTSGFMQAKPIVFDRWQLVSDMVYMDCLFGIDSKLDGIYQSLADNCTPNGILIVYLDIDPDVMLSRFEARGDKLRSAEEALKVHQGYRRFFKYGKGQILPYIRIDVTDLTREELFTYLLDLVK